MATVKDYRIELGWSIAELGRRAKLHRETVANAEKGRPIQASSAKSIATAISKGLRKPVSPKNIEGLNIL